jgi:rubrerythrin
MSNNEAYKIAEHLNCQSILENQTSLLYGALSEKVDAPLVKTLLKEIELDSQKHSMMLKGVSSSFRSPKGKMKECQKNIVTLKTITNFIKDLSKMERVSSEDLGKLSEILITLESQMGEEYYMLLQMQTLERMTDFINKQYSVDLTKIKKIFLKIITDEERHIEILETIKQLTAEKKQVSNAPFVKFQTPDSWFQPTPISYYATSP